jgi:thiosulfate/3-mercaptopyruvate sulfurtransferase
MVTIKRPKAVKAHITELEMLSPPKSSLPVPVNIQTAIMRVPEIPLPFYRYLQWQVGNRWHWVSRLRMNDAELAAIIHAKECSVTVLYVNGAPSGFFELFQRDADEVELSYFGMMEHALGMGLGKWFLLQALYAAWDLNPKKVTVTTNTLDHPRALPLYQRFGFNPVATSDAIIRPLTDDELLAVVRPSQTGI